MSTNPHFPPPGSPVYSGDAVSTDPSAVGAPTPGPASGDNQAGYPRDSGPPVPSPQPDFPRNDSSVSEAPEPPPWTDEDYVRHAEGRYGHKFTPAAARAFSEFDPSSRSVQAAEFYRYVDAHFKRFGYF